MRGSRRAARATSCRSVDRLRARRSFRCLTPLAIGPGPARSRTSRGSPPEPRPCSSATRRAATERFARVRVPARGCRASCEFGDSDGCSFLCSRPDHPRVPRARSSRRWRSSSAPPSGVTRDADFERLRRGRRPARGGRARAPASPLRRRRAPRGRSEAHVRRCVERLDSRAQRQERRRSTRIQGLLDLARPAAARRSSSGPT